MAKIEIVTIKILPHPGMSAQQENSGVQTSQGDKFAGELVDLPEDEAGLIIAAKRAELATKETPGKAKKSA